MGLSSIWIVSLLAVSPLLGGYALSQSKELPDAPSTVANTVPPSIQLLPSTPNVRVTDLGYLQPGVDPENRLLTPFLKHVVGDQKQFWTSPFREQPKNFLPILGVLGVLIPADSWISQQVPDRPDQLKRSKNISDYSVYSLIGASGGAFLLGQLKKNDHMSEAGLLSGEAALNSTLVTYALKSITQRPRPYQDNGNGTFFQGGASFPSEHSAIAWSIASVLAHEYPGPLTQFLAYGLASTVTLTRVTSKQHFSSDVVIGSALGWYLGRQIYRAHHDPELGGAPWGDLIEEKVDKGPRNPKNMGSPYVPLDSWVYPLFDRLAAMGYIQSAFLGMRPWTRMACASLVEELGERIRYRSADDEEVQRAFSVLAREFREETARIEGAPNVGIALESVYERTTGIAGAPLTDGFHFGQTIVNDYGRPYGEGVSAVAGASAHGVAGPFSFYVRGEYQHAPMIPAMSDQARQVIAAVDGLPATPPGTPTPSQNRLDLVEGYVGFQISDWQFTFGKQELWWGTTDGGSMLFSTNAAPITMLQINQVRPSTLPGIFSRLGPMRFSYILGRVTGHQWVCCTNSEVIGSWSQPLRDQPFISGQRLSFKPSPNLEVGIGSSVLVGGNGVPFTTHKLLQAMFSTNSVGTPGSTRDPGDRRGEFTFAYRIPKLRDWLTFYADTYTDDQLNPLLSWAWDKTALTAGLYVSRIPGLPKIDLRVEGVYTDLPGGGPIVQGGFFYFNSRFRSGYTNDGNLIGSWIGRQGQGAEAWMNYWISPRSKLQLHFRHQKVSQQFIPDGGSITDLEVRADLWAGNAASISSSIQYERWAFPVLTPGPQTNIAASMQLTFYPHLRSK